MAHPARVGSSYSNSERLGVHGVGVQNFVNWYPPSFRPASIPTLPSLNLTTDEVALIDHLRTVGTQDRVNMELTNAYYMGAQSIPNLRIAIPDELAAQLRTLVGWSAAGVDPYVERSDVDGFRLPDETDDNEDCARIWSANGLDAELPLCVTDALSMGAGWWLVGSDGNGSARVTVESPLNVAADFSLDGRSVRALMQTYTDTSDNWRERATLMLPDRTLHIGQDENRRWQLIDRDDHNFGVVSAVRMANNPRTDHRQGYSEITPALMSIIDSACRRLMGLEGSSELYSLPRLMILGASADDFQNPNGEMRKAWDTYISKINVIERDDEGQVPELHQLTAYDPSVFTKVIEMYASQAAGIVKALPQDLGLYTSGNPVSVESFNAMDMARNRRAMMKHRVFGVAIAEVMQMALRFENDGVIPDRFSRIMVDWRSPEAYNPAVQADAVSKLVAAGILPAASDVTLKRVGLSPVERAQVKQDRDEDQGQSMLEEISKSLEAKALRTSTTVVRDATDPSQIAKPASSGSPGQPPPA